jgi:hypothetical protein
MDTAAVQEKLFNLIRNTVPEHISVADEIAKALNISTDSAYRRIRGVKTIGLDELCSLCLHYHISLDELMEIKSGGFLFKGRNVDGQNFSFNGYLNYIKQQVGFINGFKQKDFYYLCKDIPIFHHFHTRELAAFKYYFWMKTLLYVPAFAHKKFSFAAYPDELFALGLECQALYSQLNVVEIWNIETINSTLRQIEFYRDAAMFESDKDIWLIYEALEKLMDHLEKRAEAGFMYSYNDALQKPKGPYQLYINEVILGDNSLLVELDGMRIVYLVHSGFNVMVTRDSAFCNYTYDNFHNIMQKSEMVSAVSEKERLKFFKTLKERISHRKQSLKI